MDSRWQTNKAMFVNTTEWQSHMFRPLQQAIIRDFKTPKVQMQRTENISFLRSWDVSLTMLYMLQEPKPTEDKQDRQCTYNTKARSCHHRCSGKAISITRSKCAFVALSIQHAMRMRHIVLCSLPGSTIFFHVISLHGMIKKKVLITKRVFWYSLQFCLKHSSF
jgi:hypothetical protein